MQTKKAFSFIEIIIVISILTLLAVVGMSYQGASNQKAINTRIISDIKTLDNSLVSYLEKEKTLPFPKGNINYYTKNTEYSHDETGAFGVHGFVTDNLLPKKYLNYLPLDQRTNQYYAYGKTLDNKYYEVAGVLKVEGEYVSKVVGNYPAENGPFSLIREYNGPQFISDNSKSSFPYNPEQRALVGKINNITGTVKINGNTTNILTHTLVEGDTIETSASSSATIFFSDGSQSLLEENSKLVLKNLEFQQEDNLLTNIRLFLDSGTLWTKATRLNSQDGENSEFQVSTQDTEAAVRGTIFGISYNGTTTKVQVIKGKVEVTPRLGTSVEKTDGQYYNGELTQPTFPIITEIPNNTYTGSVSQENDLLQEYYDRNTEEETGYITFNGNLVKIDKELKEEGYKLYAYAPYNKAYGDGCTDLSCNGNTDNLRQNNMLYFSGSQISVFNIDTDLEPRADYTKADYNGVKISGNPWNASRFVTYINSLNLNISTGLKKLTYNENGANVGHSLYELNGTKGVIVSEGKYLKYSNLDLGNNFAIEMRVHFPNNPGGTRYLFQLGDYKVFLINNGNIYIKNSLSFNQNINSYYDGKFHIITAIKNGNNYTLKIDGKDIGNFTSSNNIGTELYIGSKKDKTNQINDIIDYMKIYKKD